MYFFGFSTGGFFFYVTALGLKVLGLVFDVFFLVFRPGASVSMLLRLV